jgi:glutaredoxin 3
MNAPVTGPQPSVQLSSRWNQNNQQFKRESVIENQKDGFMSTRRKIEIFSAGCPACQTAIELVNGIACPSCDVTVLDMKDAAVAHRAKSLGVQSVPAIVIDGKLAGCCTGQGISEAALRAEGIGQPVA